MGNNINNYNLTTLNMFMKVICATALTTMAAAWCAGKDSGCRNIRDGDGDCDRHNDCRRGLRCGRDNCYRGRGTKFDNTDDCCYNPKIIGHRIRFPANPWTLAFRRWRAKAAAATTLRSCRGWDCKKQGQYCDDRNRRKWCCMDYRWRSTSSKAACGRVANELYGKNVHGTTGGRHGLNVCEGDCDSNS